MITSTAIPLEVAIHHARTTRSRRNPEPSWAPDFISASLTIAFQDPVNLYQSVCSNVAHVKKLWTSMYNSAYNCDFKNLIAPLNSLGTLEIYQVIKTAN